MPDDKRILDQLTRRDKELLRGKPSVGKPDPETAKVLEKVKKIAVERALRKLNGPSGTI